MDRSAAAFGAIAIAIFAFAMLFGRGTRAGAFLRAGRLLEVLETAPLPRTASLHVVRAGESYYVLGRTDAGIAVVTELSREVVERQTKRASRPGAGRS
jgi:flagellar biogenesis protein FliO